MGKAILVIDMPNCCDECFALCDNGDYPMCLITQEQKGYTFRTIEQKMDKCPLIPAPKQRSLQEVLNNIEPISRERAEKALAEMETMDDVVSCTVKWVPENSKY